MSGASVTLVFEAGPESGKSMKLATPRTVIGRRKGEIVIKDAEISGQHAEIVQEGGKWLIRDLGSTNGTFVNGKKLPTSDLKDGDRLTLGQSKILVKMESAKAAPKPVEAAPPPRSERMKAPPEPAPRPPPPRTPPPRTAPEPPPRTKPPDPRSDPRVSAKGAGGAAVAAKPAAGRAKPVNVEGIGALINEELEGFSEQTDSVIMDLARADEELKLPYRTSLYLEVIEGPDQGMKAQFPKGNMVIGRMNADVVLKDSDISRRHALVEAYTRDKIFIKDLASTNGTFVNGQKITTYDKLKSGDKIRVGKTVMRFVVEELK